MTYDEDEKPTEAAQPPVDENKTEGDGVAVITRPAPLPATLEGLRALQTSNRKVPLNALLETIFDQLWINPLFRAYIDPVFNRDAVTGRTAFDDYEASRMIRIEAGQNKIFEALLKEKEASTVERLRTVMRRKEIDRKRRREGFEPTA